MDIFEDYFKFPMKIPEDYFSETNTTFKITFKDDIITDINDFGISFFELQKANILHKNVKDFIPNFHILKNLKTPDHSVYFFKMEFKAPISTPHRLIRRHLCIIKITISKDINLSLNFPFLPIADNPIEINKAFKNILKYTDSISHAIYGPILMIRAQLHSLYLKEAYIR